MPLTAAASDAEPMTLLLDAVRETAQSACHLAALAGHAALEGAPGATRAGDAAVEASLRATRALFSLEDGLRQRGEGPGPVSDALLALAAAEDAIAAARAALEAGAARDRLPALSPRAAPPGGTPGSPWFPGTFEKPFLA